MKMKIKMIKTILKSPQKAVIQLSRWVSDLDWRLLLLLILLLPLSLLAFLSLYSTTSFPSFAPLQSLFHYRTSTNPSISHPPITRATTLTEPEPSWTGLNRTKMAVCLVGGARRFELTGPSIVEKILKVYPNSDLFLHSPFDSNSFKLSLLKIAPRIASVRIFEPKPVPETESELRVLTGSNSPNGIQGLLQYFNLVEGCLTMIKAYQQQNNFKYDWIVRTRVDGYWSAPLSPENFVPGQYLVPPGSSYGGLNDRLGIGDLNTSTVALSRFSLLPKLDSTGFRQLNSETSFLAQLTTHSVPYLTKRLPFCIVTDRTYEFPPGRFGVPVAAISSRGPLSGAKCRPCTVACGGDCVAGVMGRLFKGWSWTDWENGTLELCDAHGEWEKGWERMFDRAAGKKMAAERKRVWGLKMKECVGDFEEMRRRTTGKWEAPTAAEICKLGFGL